MFNRRAALALVCLTAICLAGPPALKQMAGGGHLAQFIPPTPELAGLVEYPVARIIDGDTIIVMDGEDPVRVRLIGVDTPETVHRGRPVEPYGPEASTFLSNLLKGESVYLLADPDRPETDRYGRRLAYVYRVPDGLFANTEIVRQGYGEVYLRFPFRYRSQFIGLEEHARSARKGLWALRAESVAPVDDEPVVFVTPTGTRYHRDGCSYLGESPIPLPLSKAREEYQPCSRCEPPG